MKSNPKVIAILQARASSTRLPGKVLLPILGKAMLSHQIDRILRTKSITQLILATSDEDSDTPLFELAKTSGIECYRGSLNDVLDRFYFAAQSHSPDYVVRLTGDCPLIDPEIIEKNIEFCVQGKFDYTSNALTPTYPDGLDNEVMTFKALETAWQHAKLSSEREHVTPYLYSHPEQFKIGILKNNEDLSSLRWTVDEKADFELVTQIFTALFPSNPHFKMQDVLHFLSLHPELKTYNTHHRRNEGYEKSKG